MKGPSRRTRLAIVFAAPLAALSMTLAPLAHAQEFERPASVAPGGSASDLLDAGLPAAAEGARLSLCSTRRFGLVELETRGAAFASSRGPLRAALGVASAGDFELGWNALAIGAGAAGEEWGAAARALVRLDRFDPSPAIGGSEALDRAGFEAGAGVWLAVAPGALAWASAPQMAIARAAPPLRRGLTIGVQFESNGLALSLEHRASPLAGMRGGHAARLELRGDALRAWVLAADAPARGAIGAGARVGMLALAAEFETHPVLPTTARVSIEFAGVGP